MLPTNPPVLADEIVSWPYQYSKPLCKIDSSDPSKMKCGGPAPQVPAISVMEPNKARSTEVNLPTNIKCASEGKRWTVYYDGTGAKCT